MFVNNLHGHGGSRLNDHNSILSHYSRRVQWSGCNLSGGGLHKRGHLVLVGIKHFTSLSFPLQGDGMIERLLNLRVTESLSGFRLTLIITIILYLVDSLIGSDIDMVMIMVCQML